MRSVGLVGLVVGALIGVDPFGWDEVGPLRWLLVSACGFAIVATAGDRVPIERLTALWAGLVGWLAVSALFGVDRLYAWIGTPDRHFGWLTWLLCGGLFVAARQLAASPEPTRLVVRALTIASLVGVAIAFAELFDWRLAEAPFAGDRLGGGFSQPALLGAASVLVAPAVASLAVDKREARLWRALGALAAAGALFTLAASQSRAAWLAAVVLVGCAVVARRAALRAAWLIATTHQRVVTWGAALVAAVIVAVSAPVPSRLSSLFGGDGGLAGRVDEWQVAWRALWARPITGWGPEGYRIAFGRHVDVEYVVDHGRRVITDRAHSGVLDAALVGGVPAGLLYTALLVTLAAALWRAIATGSPLQAGLGLGVLGYFLQQLALFPVAELDPLAWLLAGLALGPAAVGHRPLPVASVTRGLAAGLAIVAVLAGALNIAADHYVQRAVTVEDQAQALDAADTARRLRGDSIRYDFIASRIAEDADDSLERIASGLAVSPKDPALRGEQARLLLEQGLASGRSSDFEVARTDLEALALEDPNHPEHLGRLGIARATTGDENGAETAFRHAIRLDPDSREHQQNLTTLLESRKSP